MESSIPKEELKQQPKYDLTVKEVLGAGSFGCVYKVTPAGKDPVAIKHITLPKVAWSPEEELSFAREIATMKKLKDHPLIVKYIEDYEEGGNAYIVMEYASGGSLKKKLETIKELGAKLAKETVLKFITMICLGILTLHQSDLIHRDLSPKNIFIKKFDKKRELLIIGDFGTAKSTLSKNASTTLKDVFTLSYASPEQISKVQATKQSDAWAVGVMLYEMLAGYLPFDDEDIIELAIKIKTEQPAEIEDVYKEIWPIVVGLLKKKPQERLSLQEVIQQPIIKKAIADLIKEFPELSE